MSSFVTRSLVDVDSRKKVVPLFWFFEDQKASAIRLHYIQEKA